MSYYTATGKNFNTNTNGYKMIKLIAETVGCSKYDCLTIALDKIGSKQDLRGYYSCYFRGLVNNKVLNASVKGIYTLTQHGKDLLNKIEGKIR